jgi:hypothetical protein
VKAVGVKYQYLAGYRRRNMKIIANLAIKRNGWRRNGSAEENTWRNVIWQLVSAAALRNDIASRNSKALYEIS